MDYRPVVTAFVQRELDGRVLVVQRSESVSSYPLQWGGVSGGVEGEESLIERALTEVEEEVAIPRRQLRLLATGRPLPVENGSRRFMVYPFLLGCSATDPSITLNWENVDHQWVDARELAVLPHVPLLPKTLDRVLLPPHMQEHVRYLAEDRQHGAAQLASYSVQAFEEVACREQSAGQGPGPGLEEEIEEELEEEQGRRHPREQRPDAEEELEHFRNFGYALATCRPSMAAIANATTAVLLQLDVQLRARADPFGLQPGVVGLAVVEACRRVAERLSHSSQAVADHAAELLPPGTRVLTLSYSSTVLSSIIAAASRPSSSYSHSTQDASATSPPTPAVPVGGPPEAPAASPAQLASTHPRLSVVVCESRPLCEGVRLAAALSEAGVPCTVVTDAQAALFVGGCDIVLLGADSISTSGVVNKVGSFMVALAAREQSVPVYVVSDKLKLSPGPVAALALPHTALPPPGPANPLDSQEEEMDPAEVVAGWRLDGEQQEALRREALKVRNVYFEHTPAGLLAGVVTEHGTMNPEAIAKEVQRLKEAYVSAFCLPPLH